MAQDPLKTWYIDGLHAYRSATEQAKNAAVEASKVTEAPELKALVAEMATLCEHQQDAMVEFLEDLGQAPDNSEDHIQEGIIKSTFAAVQAAEDDRMRDVAVHFGSRACLTYFGMAFNNHASFAKTLGMAEQAVTLETLSAESANFDQRFAHLAETLFSAQTAD